MPQLLKYKNPLIQEPFDIDSGWRNKPVTDVSPSAEWQILQSIMQ